MQINKKTLNLFANELFIQFIKNPIHHLRYIFV